MRLTAKEAKQYGITSQKRPRGAQKARGDKSAKIELFKAGCKAWGIPEPVPELHFDSEFNWAFDFAWRTQMIALEIDGGIFGRGKACPACGRRPVGAHSSIQVMLSDRQKFNAAALAGWTVLHVLPEDVETGAVFALLKKAFYGEN